MAESSLCAASCGFDDADDETGFDEEAVGFEDGAGDADDAFAEEETAEDTAFEEDAAEGEDGEEEDMPLREVLPQETRRHADTKRAARRTLIFIFRLPRASRTAVR